MPDFTSWPQHQSTAQERSPAFEKGLRPVPELFFSTFSNGASHLKLADLPQNEAFWDRVRTLYKVSGPVQDMARQIVEKEHAARILTLHPGMVEVDPASGRCLNTPANRFIVKAETTSQGIVAASKGPGGLDVSFMDASHDELTGCRHLVFDMVAALVHVFIRRLVFADPREMSFLNRKPIVLAANHQTGVESLLSVGMMMCIYQSFWNVIANMDQPQTLQGALQILAPAYYPNGLPIKMLFFDQKGKQGLVPLFEQHTREMRDRPVSMFVHVEGRRALQAGQPVVKASSAFSNYAVEQKIPVIPGRFSGGLPRTPAPDYLEFPHELGMEDLHLGHALQPGDLARMDAQDQRNRVIQAINELGPWPEEETPLPPLDPFAQDVHRRMEKHGASMWSAVFTEALLRLPGPVPETQDLLRRLDRPEPDAEGLAPDSVIGMILAYLRT